MPNPSMHRTRYSAYPHVTMLKKLNGWQRIGVVLSVGWIISVSGVSLFEFYCVSHPRRHCLFVYDAIPVGTVWTEKFDAKGQPIAPWDYDWKSDTSVPKTRKLRWVYSHLLWRCRWLAGGCCRSVPSEHSGG